MARAAADHFAVVVARELARVRLRDVDDLVEAALVEADVERRPGQVGPEAPQREAGRAVAAGLDDIARGPPDELVPVVAVVRAGSDQDVDLAGGDAISDLPVSYTHLTLPTTPYV